MPAHNVGAGALIAPDAARALGDRWGFQPKVDGVYVTATTDADGRIVDMRTRNGRTIDHDLADVRTIPSATIVGELEAHTESGIAMARSRGWQLLHVFDLLHVRGMAIDDAPYATRYAQAVREIAEIEQAMPDAAYRRGRHHNHRGRFVDAAPLDVRRTPIVPMLRSRDGFDRLWSEYVDRDGGEGLVAVRLDAPASARGAKRKVKVTDTVTGLVLDRDSQCARVAIADQTVIVSAPAWVQPGQRVDLAHNGRYMTGALRFARIVRARFDI